jgi:hypothetical protein
MKLISKTSTNSFIFYSLFNKTASVLGYTTSNCRMLSEWWITKNKARISFPNFITISMFTWKERKSIENFHLASWSASGNFNPEPAEQPVIRNVN